jgi:beta-lactam-binding protein with PASTA domain
MATYRSWPRRRAAWLVLLVAGAGAVLAGCSTTGRSTDQQLPGVVGQTLSAAADTLTGWCANVRIVVDPAVSLTNLNGSLVTVRDQRLEQDDPATVVTAGLLRPGWAVTDTATPTPTGAATVTPTSDPTPHATHASSPTPTGKATATPTSGPTPSPTGPTGSPRAHALAPAIGGSTPGPTANDVGTPTASPAVRNVCATGQVPTVVVSLSTQVPDVTNASLSDAMASLALRALPATVAAGASADPSGRVLSQDPAAGQQVTLGPNPPPVTLTPGVSVPSAVGRTSTEACALAQARGLACAVDGPAGGVVSDQQPAPRTAVAPGSTIRFTLQTQANREVAVPQVIGMSGAQACAELAKVALTCDVMGGGDSQLVLTQNPAGDTVVSLPNTVTVTTSQRLLAVPSVTGAIADTGCSQLRTAGFGCLQQDRLDTQDPPGSVVEQDPAAGSQAAPGTIVVLFVAKGEMLTVPYVLGLPGKDACNVLQHFVCKVDGPLGKNLVAKQSPDSGTLVPAGTVVTIQFEQYTIWDLIWQVLRVAGPALSVLGGIVVGIRAWIKRRNRGQPPPSRLPAGPGVVPQPRPPVAPVRPSWPAGR